MFKEVLLYIFYIGVCLLVGFLGGIMSAKAETLRVAVIDSGFDAQYKNKVKLCPEHYTMIDNSTALTDNLGHGTHVSGLIAKYAKDADYCLIILKAYAYGFRGNVVTSNQALSKAINLNVDIINISAGGVGYEPIERNLIKIALDKGIVVIAAAGNNSSNLAHIPFYPALHDERVIVVGNGESPLKRHFKSNYGQAVDLYEPGVRVESVNGIMSGTSQSTAIATGKLVNFLDKKLKLKRNLAGSSKVKPVKQAR